MTQAQPSGRSWNFTLFNTKGGPVKADSLPYFIMHLMPIWAFFVDFHWSLILVAVASYYLRMFFATGFLHRYFSHKSFKAGRLVQFLMALAAATTVQKGALWWASHHRHHHRHSDDPLDLHSPLQSGFWHAHTGWILTIDSNPNYKQNVLKDFEPYPELKWLDKYWIVGPVLYGIALAAIGGIPWLVWGLFVSQVILWHGTYTINSLSHVYGNTRYPVTDTSKNNVWLTLITLGEGWHNNHHYYQSAARNGFYWWEIDVTYYVLLVMEKLHLIRDLKQPSERVLEMGRQLDRERREAKQLVGRRILRRLSVQEMRLLVSATEQQVDRALLRKLNLEQLRKRIGSAAPGGFASSSAVG